MAAAVRTLCALALALGCATPAWAATGAVIVGSDTASMGAIDPLVTLSDGTVLKLADAAMTLSRTPYEPRYLVIAGLDGSGARELDARASTLPFQREHGGVADLVTYLTPTGSLAFWPGADVGSDPADAEMLHIVEPGGASFAVYRPVPEPGTALVLAAGCALLVALKRRGLCFRSPRAGGCRR